MLEIVDGGCGDRELISAYAGLTRVSINFHKMHFSQMGCRVKPGNDNAYLVGIGLSPR
jgi:hypothetical protein